MRDRSCSRLAAPPLPKRVVASPEPLWSPSHRARSTDRRAALLVPPRALSGARKTACYNAHMKMNILAIADALSDRNLLARLPVLAGGEREMTVELVAHLAARDSRPALYSAEGYGSLFSYCTQALRLSEDAACNRIEAARACRRFPLILDLLASGEMTLTSVRLLGRHLTPDNHQAVLAKASGRSRPQIEALVAELAPRPDVPSFVRKLPTFAVMPPASAPAPVTAACPPNRRPRSPLRLPPCLRRPVRSSSPPPRSATGCSSPSGRRPMRGFGASRRFCVAKSRTAIPA